MKSIYLASAMLLSAVAFAPASAAPALAVGGVKAADLPIILAQYPGHDYDRRERRRDYHRDRRPHDWRMRGCILVGPLWFCP